MPSPVGHALAGLVGFMAVRARVGRNRRPWLLLFVVFLALLPDLDVLPGLALFGDPRLYHHQATHSVFAALLAGLAIAVVVRRCGGRGVWWGAYGASIYLSHVLLDLLVDDRSPPLGAQVFWPFSNEYFIAPVTPFPRFHYFNADVGMIGSVLSMHNVIVALEEMLILSPFVALAWYLAGRHDDSTQRMHLDWQEVGDGRRRSR